MRTPCRTSDPEGIVVEVGTPRPLAVVVVNVGAEDVVVVVVVVGRVRDRVRVLGGDIVQAAAWVPCEVVVEAAGWVWVWAVVVGLPGKGEWAIRDDEENGLYQADDGLRGSGGSDSEGMSGSSGNEPEPCQPGEGSGSSTHCRTSGDQMRVGRCRMSRAGVVWSGVLLVLPLGVGVPPEAPPDGVWNSGSESGESLPGVGKRGGGGGVRGGVTATGSGGSGTGTAARAGGGM